MEKQCEFIWDLIEQSPVLREKMKSLEMENAGNTDKQVEEIIEFFRELEIAIDCISESYQQTRILNNNSYLIRMRS